MSCFSATFPYPYSPPKTTPLCQCHWSKPVPVDSSTFLPRHDSLNDSRRCLQVLKTYFLEIRTLSLSLSNLNWTLGTFSKKQSELLNFFFWLKYSIGVCWNLNIRWFSYIFSVTKQKVTFYLIYAHTYVHTNISLIWYMWLLWWPDWQASANRSWMHRADREHSALRRGFHRENLAGARGKREVLRFPVKFDSGLGRFCGRIASVYHASQGWVQNSNRWALAFGFGGRRCW